MTAPAPWQSSTAHNVGDVVQAFTDLGTGFFFRCVVAGTTGSAEPFWPSFIGNETVDGTVTWKAVSIISGDFQAPDPSAIIELFELQLFANIHGVNDIYRFHAGTNLVNNGEVIWRGNPYLRFPVEADGFEYTGQGALPRPKIRISNILGSITAILLSLPNGLEAAKVTRIRTLGRYIDGVNFPGGTNPLGTPDPTAEFPREIYYIDRKSAENRELVEFELASAFDLAGVRAPKRQCIANICQWVYRSTECGYTGTNYFDANNNAIGSASLDVCGKRLSSCQVRFGTNAELPYGSYPGIGSAAS
jgi:lambda family phage minor tail protein L